MKAARSAGIVREIAYFSPGKRHPIENDNSTSANHLRARTLKTKGILLQKYGLNPEVGHGK